MQITIEELYGEIFVLVLALKQALPPDEKVIDSYLKIHQAHAAFCDAMTAYYDEKMKREMH